MPPSQHAIFMGYRRDDSRDVAGRIYDRLERRFGRNLIFKDVDAIPVGVDFAAHIQTVIAQCRVFLALIGPSWVHERLHSEGDFVRIEIETALATDGLLVVPVLVSGAAMPAPHLLPESLRPLVTRNAALVRPDPDFNDDIDRLIRALEIESLASVANVAAPAKRTDAAAQRAWALIADELDPTAYRGFIQRYPETAEAETARTHLEQLEQWAAIAPDATPEALEAVNDLMLSGPFPVLGELVKHRRINLIATLKEMEARAEAERKAAEAAQAALRAEEERKLLEAEQARQREIRKAEEAREAVKRRVEDENRRQQEALLKAQRDAQAASEKAKMERELREIEAEQKRQWARDRPNREAAERQIWREKWVPRAISGIAAVPLTLLAARWIGGLINAILSWLGVHRFVAENGGVLVTVYEVAFGVTGMFILVFVGTIIYTLVRIILFVHEPWRDVSF